MDDKRQITWTFVVTLIYQGKSRRCQPKFDFPDSVSISFTKNYWSNTDKLIEFFEEIIFSYLEMTNEEKAYVKEQHYLTMMDAFAEKDTLKE